jgi:hypothetical protein
MAAVARSVALAASADAVWALIGPFQALGDWHPAIARTDREDHGGAEHRRLHLHGGGAVFERLWGEAPHAYAYGIEDSPLPVAAYRAHLSVSPAGTGCVVVWTASFTPTAEGAEGVIGGIFEAGLATLSQRFG